MTTAIVVTPTILRVGIVIHQLLRLSRWLKKSPPSRDFREPPQPKRASRDVELVGHYV